MISRQNLEQWLKALQVEESDWQGKLNLLQGRISEIKPTNLITRLGLWILDQAPSDKHLNELQDQRLAAFKEMAMRGGAIHMCHQGIEICDRKATALDEVNFHPRYFVVEEDKQVDAEQVLARDEKKTVDSEKIDVSGR